MEATLIWTEISKDKDGFPQEQEYKADIYAEERSVARQEFYEAMRTGIQAKMILSVRIEDFELSRHEEEGHAAYARKLKYQGEIYDIIRAYKTGKAKMELTCR